MKTFYLGPVTSDQLKIEGEWAGNPQGTDTFGQSQFLLDGKKKRAFVERALISAFGKNGGPDTSLSASARGDSQSSRVPKKYKPN